MHNNNDRVPMTPEQQAERVAWMKADRWARRQEQEVKDEVFSRVMSEQPVNVDSIRRVMKRVAEAREVLKEIEVQRMEIERTMREDLRNIQRGF